MVLQKWKMLEWKYWEGNAGVAKIQVPVSPSHERPRPPTNTMLLLEAIWVPLPNGISSQLL